MKDARECCCADSAFVLAALAVVGDEGVIGANGEEVSVALAASAARRGTWDGPSDASEGSCACARALAAPSGERGARHSRDDRREGVSGEGV